MDNKWNTSWHIRKSHTCRETNRRCTKTILLFSTFLSCDLVSKNTRLSTRCSGHRQWSFAIFWRDLDCLLCFSCLWLGSFAFVWCTLFSVYFLLRQLRNRRVKHLAQLLSVTFAQKRLSLWDPLQFIGMMVMWNPVFIVEIRRNILWSANFSPWAFHGFVRIWRRLVEVNGD